MVNLLCLRTNLDEIRNLHLTRLQPYQKENHILGRDITEASKFDIGIYTMPSLKKHYSEQQMTFRHAFNAYIAELGNDSNLIWNRIKEIIALLCRSFFELSRFDFVLDKDLNVYLMELCKSSFSVKNGKSTSGMPI
uniref:Uncharacterized protein n=1 Tax=Wuchereria bancrofti TaxID=6293 RepID=A0AAF5PUY0_WUCBA